MVVVCFLPNISLVWILNISIHSKKNVNETSLTNGGVGGKESPAH